MLYYTKFCQNPIIFSVIYCDLTIFKMRPSAILDFKNLQFLSYGLCRHAVLLPDTKFRRNRTIGRWVMAKKAIFKMAVAAILNSKNFNFWSRDCSGSTFAVVYRISSKSDNFSLRYDDLTIFKMAVVRHLGFYTFAFFLSRSPWQHAVLLPRTKFRWNRTTAWWVMAKKAIFKTAAAVILNFKNFNFWSRACNRVQYLM